MAFESQNLNIQTKNLISTNEFAVNAVIATEKEKPIKHIVSVCPRATISGFESVDAELSIQGKLHIELVYASEDDTLEKVENDFDWVSSFKAFGENLQPQIFVVETTLENVSDTNVSASVLLKANVFGTTENMVTYATNFDENYVIDEQSLEYNGYFAGVTNKFTMQETFDLPENAKILTKDATVFVSGVVCGIDSVTVSGTVDYKILYQDGETLANAQKSTEYSQEIACTNLLPDHLAAARARVVDVTEKTLSQSSCQVDALVEIVVDTYLPAQAKTTKDLFNLSKNLDQTYSCLSFENYQATLSEKKSLSVETNFDLLGGEIVGIYHPEFNLSKAELENKTATVEGIFAGTLVYKNTESAEVLSTRVSAPVVTTYITEQEGTLKNIFVNAIAKGIKISTSKIDIDVDLQFVADVFAEKYVEYVETVTEKDDKPNQTSGIMIYVTKPNDTMFTVAKALGVSRELVAEQNKIEDQGFAAGQKIYIYNKLNAEF